ncbi:MAG TPA: hypothetical protein VE992_07730 [Solirubrobacteraceae bacterium]|nr:hypothetical protein [Solirubrobacteraceae bacterium]
MSAKLLMERDNRSVLARLPTAPLAGGGLIAGFAVAVATGSRPLGGVVLAAFGLTCIGIWAARDGWRTAALLTGAGLVAFAASHALGLLIGAWPAVLLVAAMTAALCWRVSDARRAGPHTPLWSSRVARPRSSK